MVDERSAPNDCEDGVGREVLCVGLFDRRDDLRCDSVRSVKSDVSICTGQHSLSKEIRTDLSHDLHSCFVGGLLLDATYTR